ncbi:hypothetical protein PM082_022680 [Marasmius tenuissimus]|nr:hypothetical protein PM082_022680 [Marasmius tenuissimus]
MSKIQQSTSIFNNPPRTLGACVASIALILQLGSTIPTTQDSNSTFPLPTSFGWRYVCVQLCLYGALFSRALPRPPQSDPFARRYASITAVIVCAIEIGMFLYLLSLSFSQSPPLPSEPHWLLRLCLTLTTLLGCLLFPPMFLFMCILLCNRNGELENGTCEDFIEFVNSHVVQRVSIMAEKPASELRCEERTKVSV